MDADKKNEAPPRVCSSSVLMLRAYHHRATIFQSSRRPTPSASPVHPLSSRGGRLTDTHVDRHAREILGRTASYGGPPPRRRLPMSAHTPEETIRLAAPVDDLVDRLPAPQRDALQITFGVSAGAAPDRFLVALATLSLFSEAAQERPLLCVVDDAQWLDRASAQALGFVARRLLAEPVALLFAARETTDAFAGLPELLIEGLDDAEARKLLAAVIPGRLDDRVADQLVAEAHGNPLALTELPRGLSPAQLAGGFGLPGALSLAGRIEQSFLERLEALPESTQRLLLVAAAWPPGDPAPFWRGAARLRIPPPAARAAAARRRV